MAAPYSRADRLGTEAPDRRLPRNHGGTDELTSNTATGTTMRKPTMTDPVSG